jgi:hypothetical protein
MKLGAGDLKSKEMGARVGRGSHYFFRGEKNNFMSRIHKLKMKK